MLYFIQLRTAVSPQKRPNRYNVQCLARKAHIDIVKASGGWVVKMASKIGKKFKRLRDIWLILTKEEWYLHDDFFPHTEEVARAASAPAAPAPAAPARAASAPAAPAPESSATNSSNLTRLERNQIEVLRAEWRAFPSMRHAIEERMAEFGIVLEPT